MTNKKGFTLTEILLAVMIVGVIGVALAALTTSASRESGVGRSRMLMRDNLSLAMRQLRQDIQEATQVLYVHGKIQSSELSNSNKVPLLVLRTGSYWDGTALPNDQVRYITYCFVPGTETTLSDGNTPVRPAGAKDGGTIYRKKTTTLPWINGSMPIPKCSDAATNSDFREFLRNVKFIPPSSTQAVNYPVPLFEELYTTDGSLQQNTMDYSTLGTQLRVKLVLEVPSSPVVNDVTEEILTTSNGYANLFSD